MKGKDKAQGQLMEELDHLRRRVAELESAYAERKQVDEALRTSEEKLRSIFALIPDSVSVIDLNGKIIDENDAGARLYGFTSKDQAIGLNGFDFLASSDKSRVLEIWHNIFVTGTSDLLEFKMRRNDSSEFDGEVIATAIRDKDGKPQGIIAVMRDVTERKRMEDALRTSEEKLRLIFALIPDSVSVIDLNGVLVEQNDANLRLFGFTSKDQAIGLNGFDFLASSDKSRALASLPNILEKESGGPVEYKMLKRDGSEFDGEVTATLMRDRDGKPQGILAVIRDVTERKQWENKLKESKEELRFYLDQTTKAQEEERQRIARELHDDTIQELITLSRQLDDLADTKIRPDEDRMGSRKKIEEAQQRVDAILKGIRRFIRDLRPSVLDDLGLVPALEWLASDMYDRFGVPINISIIGTKEYITPDAVLVIFRVAQESLRNAGQHSKASQIQLNLKYTSKTATLSIIDNGKGFTPPKQTSSLTRRGKLGVAGMYERAQLVRANLSIKSKRNKGTTVTLEVPI